MPCHFLRDRSEVYGLLIRLSTVNHGHCHPRIHAALEEQSQRLALAFRAFHNDQLDNPANERNQEFFQASFCPALAGWIGRLRH